MALKEKRITGEIGRDQGKIYHLTEMPALKAEKWAVRAFLALGSGGVEVPDEYRGGGIVGLAAYGFQALSRINFALAEPLMDEMLGCIQRVEVHPESKNTYLHPIMEGDIEEVRTIWELRDQVFELHTGFFAAAALSELKALVAAAIVSEDSSSTSTSPGPSEPFSPPTTPSSSPSEPA